MPTPLLRRSVAVSLEAAEVFQALYADSENAFWLDGGTHASSGMSYLGATDTRVDARSWSELFAAVGDDPGFSRAVQPTGTGEEPRFRLGWVGWLAYELGTLDEERAAESSGAVAGPLARSAPPADGPPLAVWLRIDRAVEIDHASGSIALLAHEHPDAEGWFERTSARLETAASKPRGPVADGSPQRAAEVSVAVARHSPDAYAALVDACRALIVRGEAYQLCLTNQFAVAVHPDPLETYLRMRQLSPSHHGGFLRAGDTTLLSASPERFLAVTADGSMSTRPIKGTRPRGLGPVEDALLAEELVHSEKERAENLMIVDLMRNDLARVAQLGSVSVEELFAVESYPQVHQLVSTVAGRLREGLTGLDAVAACFPAGSMTGAPKRSAMRHLAALEGGPRGIYAGAFGYLSFDGGIDLAMVIRSIVLTPTGATIGAGGGITALSETRDEVEETMIKAAPLLAVLGAAVPDRQEQAKV